jgi:hypothetical protein
MLRIDLAVPSSDNDAARRLGALWDPARGLWFVPEDRDASPFAEWLPAANQLNVRAPSYFLATASLPCWRCRGSSRVHGFALPAGHQTLCVDDDSGDEAWEMADEPSFVCYLEYLPSAIVARIREHAASYRYAFRHRTQTFYWVNFCEYCDTKLGDYDTFCEPGQGFMPLTREDAARITLMRIHEPFSASAGGWSIGVELFEFMSER